MDHLKDAIVVLGRDGRVREANAAFAGLAGAKKEEIAGRDCREVPPLSYLWNAITGCILHRQERCECLTYQDKVLEVTITPIVMDGDLNHVCVVLKDITSLVSLERECQQRNQELVVTNALSSAFISSDNLGSVFSELLDRVLSISQLGAGWIATTKNGAYELQCSSGISGQFRESLTEGKFDFVYGDALRVGEPLYVLEPEEAALVEGLRQEGVVFVAAIPLKASDEMIGFLVLASKRVVKFDFAFASLLSLIGNNISLIAEKIRLFQEAHHLAVTDSLTGLYNMRYFYAVLDSEIARTMRYGTLFSVVLFDIDDFKSLNDTYGHQAGDEVLRSVSDVMKSTARKTDVVARYGGEEFIALLPNTPKGEAIKLAARIKKAVEEAMFLEPEEVKVTMSGGIASCPADAREAKTLLYAADMAMYNAKAAGKKQIHRYRKR